MAAIGLTETFSVATAVPPQAQMGMFREVRMLVSLSLVALVLASCASGPSSSVVPSSGRATASPSPTATEVPRTSTSPVPSPSPSADDPGLAVGRLAEVVTTDLVVRSLPEISDASAIDPITVPIGFLAYIVDGPVAADGYDWYRVAPFPPSLTDVPDPYPTFGWLAAAGKDGEPWIAPWAGDCPELNWDGIILSQRLLALGCLGGADLTLEGTLERCVDESPLGGEPAWLFATPCHLVGPDYGEGFLSGGLGLTFAPDLQATARDGARVRVTGHLDDPAADTCTEVPFPGAEPTHPDLVRVRCRMQFVVTGITEL